MIANLLMLATLIPSVVVFAVVLKFFEWRADKKHARLIEDGLQRYTAKTVSFFPAFLAGMITWGVLLTLIQPLLPAS